MPPAVARAEIEAALALVPGQRARLTSCTPLAKGHGHQSFVLEIGSGPPVLLKIALRRGQLDRMRSLGQVLDLAARHGVPAPRLLHLCEDSPLFGARPWLVQEFLDGRDGEVAVLGMSAPERRAFFRDFGAAVARLHAVDPGYFADDLAAGARVETWSAAVGARVAHLVARHAVAGMLRWRELDTAAARLRAAIGAVSAVRRALVHRDLYLPNTLVTGNRFRCLLDFEHARSADAVTDFVKLGMWVFEAIPDSGPAFCKGYGGDPLASDDGRRRHHIALGLELLAGLLYWTATGQRTMLGDYHQRFQEWLHAPR